MIKGQFCTMEKHLVHSNAVLRLKGQECKGVNDQGSILYYGDLSHLSFLDLLWYSHSGPTEMTEDRKGGPTQSCMGIGCTLKCDNRGSIANEEQDQPIA